jgi:hypothetical protein
MTAPVAWTLTFEYAATLIHHVWGGLVYRAPERLVIALVMTVAFAGTLALLRRYRTRRTRSALTLFAALVLIVWILVLGVFEGAYNHAYKDALFLAGVSPAAALELHPNLAPGDYVYPPNDAVFEITGVLQAVGALVVLVAVRKAIKSEWGEARHARSHGEFTGRT